MFLACPSLINFDEIFIIEYIGFNICILFLVKHYWKTLMATHTAFQSFYHRLRAFKFVALGGLLFLILVSQSDYFYKKIHAHAYAVVEKELGAARVVPTQEAFIMQIAKVFLNLLLFVK